MGEDNPATTTIQTTTTEEEEEKLDPLKSIKDQIVAYDPEDKDDKDKEADGGNPLTKEQESEALPTLKSGQKYTCFTCQTQDSYKWFKSKMEENVGKVICKRCYHKELVELSDKICAVRSCVFDFFPKEERKGRHRNKRIEYFLLLLTFFTNALILSPNHHRRAAPRKHPDVGTDRRRTIRSVCAKSATRKRRDRWWIRRAERARRRRAASGRVRR
jgi:Zn ribbon nucleic-acid-binding protein